ncbi:MAG: tetratricopeptide repeat protein [bacterium]|nr:tetratricopeptide repeat protein [bacterium]
MDELDSWNWKKLFAAIWLPVAVGFVIRGLYLYEYSSSVLFLSPSVDALYHLDWAEKISHGIFFPEPGHPFFRAPLYPFFLGLLSWLGCTQLLLAWVQVVLSLVSIVLIAAIAARLHSLCSARIAAWIAAIYAPLFTYQIEFQLPVLIVPLFLGVVYNFIVFDLHGKARSLLCASVGIGLLAITQVNGLVLLLVLFYFIFRNRLQLGLRSSILVGTLWLVPILPITLANWIEAKQFVPIATQGGVNFYLGNNPIADGAYAVHPQLGYDWTWDDAKAFLEAKTDAEADRAYYRKGIEFWREHPQAAIKVTLRKLGYLFHHFEIGNNRDLQRFWQERPIARWLFTEFAFGVLATLGLASMIHAFKNCTNRIVIISGLLFLLSYVPFFITARYRLPFAVLLIPFASILLARLSDKHSRYSLSDIVAIVMSVVLVWLPVGVPKIDPAHYEYTKGNAYLRLHRYNEAVTCYRKALSVNPVHELSRVNYSTILIANNRFNEADTLLMSYVTRIRIESRDSLADKTIDGKVWNNLGVVYQQLGEFSKADSFYSNAVRSNRPDRIALDNISNLIDAAFQCDTTDLEQYRKAFWYLYKRMIQKIQLENDDLDNLTAESREKIRRRMNELVKMDRHIQSKNGSGKYLSNF